MLEIILITSIVQTIVIIGFYLFTKKIDNENIENFKIILDKL